jgi:hypothetical protein
MMQFCAKKTGYALPEASFDWQFPPGMIIGFPANPGLGTAELNFARSGSGDGGRGRGQLLGAGAAGGGRFWTRFVPPRALTALQQHRQRQQVRGRTAPATVDGQLNQAQLAMQYIQRDIKKGDWARRMVSAPFSSRRPSFTARHKESRGNFALPFANPGQNGKVPVKVFT